MIVELVVSGCFQCVACGSCSYLLIKHSYDEYGRLLPRYAYASVCIGIVVMQSVNIFYCGLIRRAQTVDPEVLERQEYELMTPPTYATMINGMYVQYFVPGLVNVLYYHYRYVKLGNFLVFILTGAKEFQTTVARLMPDYIYKDVPMSEIPTVKKVSYVIDFWEPFGWVLIGGTFSYAMGNSYGMLSYMPYIITMYGTRPEEFNEDPTIRRVIHNYLIIGHILLMTDALRQ